MSNDLALSISQLSHKCDLELLTFKDTSTVEKFKGFFGQERAIDAFEFGIGMDRSGYNFFVMGNPHTGRFSFALDILKGAAKKQRKPLDWLYINNFSEGHSPVVVSLNAGKGIELRKQNSQLLEAILSELPAAFESPNFQRKKTRIEKKFNSLYDKALEKVEEQARSKSIALYRDAGAIGFTPVGNGQALDEAEFSQLDEAVRLEFNQNISDLEDYLSDCLAALPIWRREAAEDMKKLENETTQQAVEPLLKKLKSTYNNHSKLLYYYTKLIKHLSYNIDDFLHDEKTGELLTDTARRARLSAWYGVNLLIDNSKTKGSPVVYEAHPTYENLFGRLELVNDMNALATSYQRIRAGALHKANGGYLIVDAEKLLEMPHVYSALKRALKAKEIRIEHISQEAHALGSSLQSPQAVELKVKIALVGARSTYYLLQELDPDFEKTFRVVVDFDEVIPRTDKSVRNYSRLIKTLADQEGLAAFTQSAVARLIEQSSRNAQDTTKLSSHIGDLVDLLCEADYKRILKEEKLVSAAHVDAALSAQQERTGRLRSRLIENVLTGVVLIGTIEKQVGICNGLTVLSVGDVSFGVPARITATVFPGDQGVLDIEREVDLGQSIHSKGVLILSGYLGYKYAQNFPIKISANIAIEQSYGAIDGDSASLAEVCALISSITKIPINQSYAITGSINQFGDVQVIGGVNEKIEGFFEICKLREFVGGPQGVIIPKANVRNLMLKQEVIDAVAEGSFVVYAVESVDQCLALLMNSNIGQLNDDNKFTKDSVNAIAVEKLRGISSIKN
jgi:predicted ATP-dependent protease